MVRNRHPEVAEVMVRALEGPGSTWKGQIFSSFVFFCILVRRRAMPRKGWSTVEVPDGWLQITRGRRPPAPKWFRAKVQTPCSRSPVRRCASTRCFDASPVEVTGSPEEIPSRAPPRAGAELVQLKGGVDPDAPCGLSVKRPCRTGEVRGIPAMPILVPVELNMWLEERHAHLRDTLLQGDSNPALELSDGVEQMVEMTDGCAHECAGQAMQACHGEVWFLWAADWGGITPRTSRRRSQFDTQLDSSDSDEPLVRCGRFAVLSSTSDDEAVAVRCSSEREDHSRVAVHPDVESRVQDVASHPV